MLSTINQIKAEVLYEKVFAILRMYADYLQSTLEPCEAIESKYKELCTYPDLVLLCRDDEELKKKKKRVASFESFIVKLRKEG